MSDVVFTIEQEPDLIFYHFPCLDGFCSAVISTIKWPNVVLVPINYGPKMRSTIFDNIIGDSTKILFLDFFPGSDITQEILINTNRKITVLDHHKSAFKEAQDLLERGTIDGVFDMERSGAGITWDILFPEEVRPVMVDYIEDRDIWAWKYGENSRLFHAFIASHEYDFEQWRDFMLEGNTTGFIYNALKEGKAIERKHMKDINELIETTLQWKTIAGHEVPVINIPYTHGSEASSRLLDMYPNAPFAAYYVDNAGHRKWGFRSRDDRVDVSEIASSLGGGGHRNASGAELPFDEDLNK